MWRVSDAELWDVALYSTVKPLLRVSLSRYHELETPSHASIFVTRAPAGIESVSLVPLSDVHPAYGCGARVTPSPRMFTV